MNNIIVEIENYMNKDVKDFKNFIEKISKIVTVVLDLNMKEHMEYWLLMMMLGKEKMSHLINDFKGHNWKK